MLVTGAPLAGLAAADELFPERPGTRAVMGLKESDMVGGPVRSYSNAALSVGSKFGHSCPQENLFQVRTPG